VYFILYLLPLGAPWSWPSFRWTVLVE